MFSKNTIFSYIFLFCLFPGLIVSCEFLKFVDELVCLLLLVLVGLECYVEGWQAIRKHKHLWLLTCIMFLYAIYSIVFQNYNTPVYILKDFVSQIKPFVPFFIVWRMNLVLIPQARPLARLFCIVNACLMLLFYIIGQGQLHLPFGHIAYLGGICMISSLLYIYCSRDEEGFISCKHLWIAVAILSVGLICGRSKYFGQYIITMALIFGYRPGMFRHITYRHVLSFICVLALVLVASWGKIKYYFIQGAMDMIANESLEAVSDSFARPMLYVTGAQILVDHFPFGSGLASFASNASAEHYSGLYYDYGLDKVWGLSPQMSDFICDAYYPTLCQFGIVGILLFIYLWKWIYQKLSDKDFELRERFRYDFIVGIALIVFILIESIGGTQFIQSAGLQSMMILGLIVARNEQKT